MAASPALAPEQAGFNFTALAIGLTGATTWLATIAAAVAFLMGGL